MGRYNLLDEEWIPVLRKDTGTVELVSLLGFFEHAQEYRSLAGEMETQNFALLRLLLAILITVFSRVDAEGHSYEWLILDKNKGKQLIVQEPVDVVDAKKYVKSLDHTWETIWKAGRFPLIISQYLEAWRNRFYLFDKDYPFYQINEEEWKRCREKEIYGNGAAKSKKGECNLKARQINRLISESNNKQVLFAPIMSSDEDKDQLTYDQLARWLIMYQGYAGQSDKPKFSQETPSKGWLYEIGGIYLEGDSLFETMMFNSMFHFITPPDRKYLVKVQSPCWEKEIASYIDERIDGVPLDNFANLYTAWSRAIYIKLYEKQRMEFWSVKLPAINKNNFWLEPMTAWELDHNSQSYRPKEHKPEEAMWRSFGVITMQGEETKRPAIMRFYQFLREKSYVNNNMVALRAVALQAKDSNSAMPADEIADVLYLKPILFLDEKKDGWKIHIKNVIEDTKSIIENTYGKFLYTVACIYKLQKKNKEKDMDKISFVKTKKAELYDMIDRSFRDWLRNIKPEENMEAQERKWKLKFYSIVLSEAEKIMEHANRRDYIINDKGENIVTAYKYLKFRLKP